MRIFAPLLPIVILAAGGAVAQVPVARPTTVRVISAATGNLVNCAIAQNSGDVRWLIALVQNKTTLRLSAPEGAQTNAVESVLMNCPIEAGADTKEALTLIIRGIRLHSMSVNMPRRMDKLADCLTSASPQESLKFLETADQASAKNNAGAVQGDYTTGIKPILEASPSCSVEIAKIGDALNANELYSRINWTLRATSALAASTNKAAM